LKTDSGSTPAPALFVKKSKKKSGSTCVSENRKDSGRSLLRHSGSCTPLLSVNKSGFHGKQTHARFFIEQSSRNAERNN